MLKTRTRTVTTLEGGRTILREALTHCVDHPGRVHRSEDLMDMTPPRSAYGWDVVVHIGLQRFSEHRQVSEISKDLLVAHGVDVPERTVHHLATRFIEYWTAVHIESIESIRDALEGNGGYVLHLDATQENGSRPLFVAKEGLTGMVLWAVPVPSENKRDLARVLSFLKDAYGTPMAAVRDMGLGVTAALNEVFLGTCTVVCHFHFLRAVGERLLRKHYKDFHKRMDRTGVKGRLHKLLANLGKGEAKGPREHRVEQLVRHVLAYRRDGEGLGVPFSLPAVSFYERCLEAEGTLREWIMEAAGENVHDVHACRFEDILRRLHPPPAERGKIQAGYDRLKVRQSWFLAVREALRYRNGPVPLSTLASLDDEELERARAGLAVLLERMDRAIEGPAEEGSDKGLRRALAGVRRLIVENEPFLLAPNVRIGEGVCERTVQLPRTNNALEQAFRAMRRHYRRIQGNSDVEGRVQREGVGMALALNIGNPDYTRAVYGGENRIIERFRELRPESIELARELIQGDPIEPNRFLP